MEALPVEVAGLVAPAELLVVEERRGTVAWEELACSSRVHRLASGVLLAGAGPPSDRFEIDLRVPEESGHVEEELLRRVPLLLGPSA
jgi:hypothetical protein